MLLLKWDNQSRCQPYANQRSCSFYGCFWQTSMTSALRYGSVNSPSISMMRFSASSFENTWQSSSLESMNWQRRSRLLTAVQWRGLILRRLWRRVLLRALLMRKPTSCMSSRPSSILKVRLRSCQWVRQECCSSAKAITLRSQSPPKGCLWGLMKDSESCLQSQFMRSAVKACLPSTLLRLCLPHCSEKRSCFSKQSSFSSIILIDKTACLSQRSQQPPSRQCSARWDDALGGRRPVGYCDSYVRKGR